MVILRLAYCEWKEETWNKWQEVFVIYFGLPLNSSCIKSPRSSNRPRLLHSTVRTQWLLEWYNSTHGPKPKIDKTASVDARSWQKFIKIKSLRAPCSELAPHEPLSANKLYGHIYFFCSNSLKGKAKIAVWYYCNSPPLEQQNRALLKTKAQRKLRDGMRQENSNCQATPRGQAKAPHIFSEWRRF